MVCMADRRASDSAAVGDSSHRQAAAQRSYSTVAASTSHASSGSTAHVVLSHVHVSCFITAANRATPVFEVLPERKCVRVISKPAVDGSATTSGLTSGAAANSASPSVEWEFHTLFASSAASHAVDFFREITLPAFQSVLEGVNANVLAFGVHPTQKFRLLFGKSTGINLQQPNGPTHSFAETLGALIEQNQERQKDVLETYGQVGGLLHAFFQQYGGKDEWRVGLSSWIIVHNNVLDLLKPVTSSAPSTASPTFVSLEAKTFASACRVLQTAKTNRIVLKQNAEHAHFFVRMAFYQASTGQVSTLHVTDLVDMKDFKEAGTNQEKAELYDILHDLRQPLPPSVRQSMSPNAKLATTSGFKQRQTVLSNFIFPLLTSNSKTFLYANVIDSRTSLRESVQLLNALANVKDFSCACRRLRGVDFKQLSLQPLPEDADQAREVERQAAESRRVAAGMAVGESLLTQLAAFTSSSPPLSPHTTSANSYSRPVISSVLHSSLAATSVPHQRAQSFAVSPAEPTPLSRRASDTMSWLEAFTQRKNEILGGTLEPPIDLPRPSCSDGREVTQDAPLPSLSSDPGRSSEQNDLTSVKSSSEQRASRRSTESRSPLPIHDEPEGQQTQPIPRASLTWPQEPPQLGVGNQQQQSDAVHPTTSVPSLLFSPGNHVSATEQAPSSVCEAGRDAQTPLEMPFFRKQPSESQLSSPAARASAGTPLVKIFSASDPSTLLETTYLPGLGTMAPNVEGLDAMTASKVQAMDAALLRKNYDALLNIVQEQQQLREAAETRAAEATHDLEEQRATFEVQIENMKLENVRLRAKVRTLEKRTHVAKVFDQYDHDMQLLMKELQHLRSQNVTLELKLASTTGSPIQGNATGLTDLKRKYQQAVDEKYELEQQIIEFKKKERHFLVHSKLVGETTKRVDQLSRELGEKEEALLATRLRNARSEAMTNQVQVKAEQLEQENHQLLLDKAATKEELLATKMYLASLETEQKKAAILDRFVQKHGDRMSRMRDPVNNAASAWRRDQQTVECEERLFTAVKRALPQMVPMVNKILRKLETQEMSLREYSEREVDFINLLVELVSDQPALSLKRMIEEEMRKLHVLAPATPSMQATSAPTQTQQRHHHHGKR
ncbi:TPA: hypothetical protein N0F65_009369 [Lagenidium giganteum]|uniref:Kinesin motor domain-containing protein n=1 Tax=Lagenidium giganteum TaxID=4803 RepID=A0AAV2ZF30_9STRA|nr:TPA: hypothetical protein N0F65_009369 [Lagenidium giganteum]